MKRSLPIVLLVSLIFFVISFITNVLGPLVPHIISGFALSLALASFLPFSFFVAYGVMSIPAGIHLAFLTLAYLLAIGFWAKPLINNATVSFSELVQAIPKALRRTRTA
jgi:fucose permease